jgi:glycosyltransferase involved in cell wall biosynthesis
LAALGGSPSGAGATEAAGASGAPEVTVVIPTFDRAATLPRAVDSVLAQKGAAFELIIADDGSTDGTAAALERYRSDPRVRVLSLPHGGVSAARNAGAAAGTAPWIAFLDSDDEWLPGKLAAQLAHFREKGFRIGQTRERWVRRGVRVNPPDHAVKQEGDLFAVSLERCMITPSSVMLERRLFEECGGFRADFPACEDYELWLRLTAEHQVGLVSRDLLVRYGGHADQLSAKYPALDRFRIRAIALLLEGKPLAPERRALALSVLSRKLGIYQQGCERRGHADETAWCLEVRKRFLQNP